jgi:hypothetical protein
MTNRRMILAASGALAFAAGEPLPAVAFGDRAHIAAHPAVKEKLTWCFATVVGCGAPAILKVPAMSEPILAFRFPGGGSLSVEFTENALEEQLVRRGAWLEIRSTDPAALKEKILAAGLAQVRHPASNTFYFAAPGGQVFGVVPALK